MQRFSVFLWTLHIQLYAGSRPYHRDRGYNYTYGFSYS